MCSEEFFLKHALHHRDSWRSNGSIWVYTPQPVMPYCSGNVIILKCSKGQFQLMCHNSNPRNRAARLVVSTNSGWLIVSPLIQNVSGEVQYLKLTLKDNHMIIWSLNNFVFLVLELVTRWWASVWRRLRVQTKETNALLPLNTKMKKTWSCPLKPTNYFSGNSLCPC